MKRYLVKTAKENLSFLSHFQIENLKVNEEDLEFYTNYKNLEEMQKIFTLEFTDLFAEKSKNLLRKHLITIIGSLIIMLALINQNYSIRRIEFTNQDTYNEEVLIYLDKYFHKVGPFSYLNTDLTSINNDLRSRFYQYEWIGVHRKGAILYLDIKEIKYKPIEDEKTPGSLIAKESGIVKRYHVEKGIILVQEEVYVEKGSLLISGTITHQDNHQEEIRAKGYVIAEVLKYYDFKIPKMKSESIKTGRMKTSKTYFLLSWKFSKDKKFYNDEEIISNQDQVYLGFLRVKKNYHYEVANIKTIYSAEEAIYYAKSLVNKEFLKNKINEFEKIIYNDLVRIEEDQDYYHIRLIVKRYQNIAEFIPLKK